MIALVVLLIKDKLEIHSKLREGKWFEPGALITTGVDPINLYQNNYPNYYELSLQLLRPNGIIIIDNMLWHGDVADENKTDFQTNTIRDLNKKIQQDDRVNFSLLPLSDGLSFIRKK